MRCVACAAASVQIVAGFTSRTYCRFDMDRIRTSAMATMTLRGNRFWLGGHNLPAKRRLVSLASRWELPPVGPLDGAFLAPLTNDEAVYFAKKNLARLTLEGAIAVLVPADSDRSPDIPSLDGLQRDFLSLGLVISDVEPFDQTFQLLVFRREH